MGQHTRDLPTYDAAVYPAVPGPVDGNQRKQAGPMKKRYRKTKSVLRENPYTNPFFPPNGEVATTLTLILTIIAIFFTARTVLGPIADIGGTVFALLLLILLALIGGKLVLGLGWLIKKTCGVEIRLPPLLGMLLVGIILKNVPYNFGQFGRAECTPDGHNASFVDSINELDPLEEHGSFKRSIPEYLPSFLDLQATTGPRVVRSSQTDDIKLEDSDIDHGCKAKYI